MKNWGYASRALKQEWRVRNEMRRYSFNLVDNKWIPCFMMDGKAHELGLLETLSRAHEIVEVFDSSPVITASLHRLLLAVLHRNFGPASTDEWKSMWQANHFDRRVLQDYFQKWYRRFDLFDQHHPFYQVAQPGNRKWKTVPINDLLAEQSRGNNPTLFDHTYDDGCRPLSANLAARGLVAIQNFKLRGLSGLGPNFVDAPLAPNVVFLLRGENLFKTLMLNLVCYDPRKDEPMPSSTEDCPAWEQDGLLTSSIPNGYLDYLTWQTLSLRLQPADSGSTAIEIGSLRMALGRNLRNDGSFLDPAVAYRRDLKWGWNGLRFRKQRALWRDSTSLFRSAEEDKYHQGLLCWVGLLVQRGIVERSAVYRLDACGMCTDRAKIEFWRHERMPLPLDYLADETLVNDLQFILNKAEAVGKALKNALWTFAKGAVATAEGRTQRDAARNLVEHLGDDRLLWAKLEAQFYRMLPALPKDREKAIEEWMTRLRGAAWEAFDEATRDLDRSARTLRALIEARRSLASQLRRAIE
jgi:CRISPR system Cascade subunit CasA